MNIRFHLFTIACIVPCIVIAHPHPTFRSSSENLARQWSGWHGQVDRHRDQDFAGGLSATLAYTRTFNASDLAHCLFGADLACKSSCNPAITISGTLAENRGTQDWCADYFGLPTDYKSTVSFDPRIDTYVVEYGFHYLLNGILQGLYVHAHAPFVHSKWRLGISEHIDNAGTNDYAPNYFVSTKPLAIDSTVKRDKLLSSFSAYAQGETPTLLFIKEGTTPSGIDPQYVADCITFQPLACTKMHNDCHNGPLVKNSFADLRFVIGWQYDQHENFVAGIGLLVAAPIGNTPKSEYLFEPLVGNGKHWELGVELFTHADIWHHATKDIQISAHMFTHISHLFNSCQIRCFDLCGKPNSRYMLAAKHGNPPFAFCLNEDPILLKATDGTNIPAQFINEYAPVANLTAHEVSVNVDIQGELLLALSCQTTHMTFDIGYNFWAKSADNISLKNNCKSELDGKTWTLKGDAYVYGFKNTSTYPPVSLAVSQHQATIHSGTNNPPDGIDGNPAYANPGVDNPTLAFDQQNMADGIYNVNATITELKAVNISNPLIALSTCDLDLAGTKGRSHKVFAHMQYAWVDHECYIPMLGIGGEAEFGATHTKNTDSCSHLCSLSQWSVWVKAAVYFS